MADEEKKKSIFDRAIDALTNRDEKAAAEKAAADKAAAEKAAADEAARRTQAEAAARQQAAAAEAARQQSESLARMAAAEAAARQKMEAEKRAADAEAKMHEMEAEEVRRQQQAHDDEERRKYAELQAQLAEKAKPKFIAEHTIVSGDSLSQIAMNYYGHATRDYWMLIYEANKAVIGDNPGMIHPGVVLHIPQLPEDMPK